MRLAVGARLPRYRVRLGGGRRFINNDPTPQRPPEGYGATTRMTPAPDDELAGVPDPDTRTVMNW